MIRHRRRRHPSRVATHCALTLYKRALRLHLTIAAHVSHARSHSDERRQRGEQRAHDADDGDVPTDARRDGATRNHLLVGGSGLREVVMLERAFLRARDARAAARLQEAARRTTAGTNAAKRQYQASSVNMAPAMNARVNATPIQPTRIRRTTPACEMFGSQLPNCDGHRRSLHPRIRASTEPHGDVRSRKKSTMACASDDRPACASTWFRNARSTRGRHESEHATTRGRYLGCLFRLVLRRLS
jgi:hypothetical protein